MPIQSFAFGTTHSLDDHRPVRDALELINKLPAYSSGAVRFGSSVNIANVEASLAQEERYIEAAKKRIENERCMGYNAETIAKSKEYLDGLNSYADALRTIRDYMKSYSGCCPR